MAVESIGALYPTKIPGYADAADIQAALRAYHYGSYTYDTTNTSTASLEANSMAKFLFDLETDITALENRPSSGGEVDTTAPAAGDFIPAEIPDGFIWVDQDGSLGGGAIGATAVFTNSAPTTSITTGTVWVDKDATAVLSNPFIPQAIIAAKGDLLAGTANDTVAVLPVGTNGQVLKANSATTSGLEWAADNSYSAPTIGSTSIASGATVTTIAGLTLTTPNIGAATGTSLTATGGGVLARAASTQDGVEIRGRSGGTNNWEVIITPTTLSADRTLTLPDATTTIVGTDVVQTLTNKTLTSPVVSTPVFIAPEERFNIVASAATGTIAINILTAGVWYYTSNATANHTLNFRGDGSNTLNSILTIGDAVTVLWLNTNGATPYYPNVYQVDGTTSGVTVNWSGGTAPSAGNASGIDAYSFTIVKTADATFRVLAAGAVKYA
jgi:hypothetical protein